MAKTLEERLKEFFEDPRHSEESEFFRAGVKRVLGEIATEEKERRKREKEKPEGGFLAGLLGKTVSKEKED